MRTYIYAIFVARCCPIANAQTEKLRIFFICSKKNDAHQVIENISRWGRRSLILTDSREGVIVFDLSFALRYGLIIVIIPQFSKNEMLEICKKRLIPIMEMTEDIRPEAFSLLPTPVSDEVVNFAERLIALVSVEKDFSEPFISNSITISELRATARTICSFYGCSFEIILKNIQENI